MSEFSNIACEACRTKKRKCDRKIPTCAQCVHASQTCTYPGTNKRGLPPGYLANIEERLAQTENALLQALAVIHGSEVHQNSNQQLEVPAARIERPRELEFNEVRIARVEDWRKFPLETQEQQRHWMNHRLKTTERPSDPGSGEHQQETVNLTSHPQKRHRDQETEFVSRRRRLATASRYTPDLGEDDRFQSTTPAATAVTGPLTPAREDTWTADNMHPDTLSSYLGTTTPNLRHQHTNIRSPALNPASRTPQPRTSEPPVPRLEVQSEQSKAKRLVALHSRKYF